MMNNGGPDSSTTEVYADDIEKEANSYFQQMFSGQLTVDEMIQMLAGFKESSEKREKSIFECMIANLFEEYKFFNRYPDKQLKLAAILFGLLIRNQLVTHLTLGIALRAVLDALRKPADSKMFVFGTKALEKFIDRLNEWPQYCQHILQISHLRGAHPELVTFIERSVIRTSSGHPESDAAYNPAADQHQSAIPQANIEVPGSSFPLIGSGGVHLSSQISSPIQLQQRNQSYLDERQRASVTSSNYMKPNLSTSGQVAVAPTNDPVNIPKGQLSVLKYAVSAPPEVFTFAHCKRQLANVDAVNSHKSQPGHTNHAWLCLDLLEILCQLAERGLAKNGQFMCRISFLGRNCIVVTSTNYRFIF
ncbi:transcription regulator [Artemisia annua]|uniref:Transcription regulator n=1 Tax=Artemisia annua TaxID=35608 RepID=A0A2U1P618_ARTAN|nr:transcription regulator [Artemisia annua]